MRAGELPPALIFCARDGTLSGSGLELAIEVLDQGLAVLVPLLVVADLTELRRGETVEHPLDLLDVELVVVRDREPATGHLALDEPQTLPVVRKRRVEQIHIRIDRLLKEDPQRLPLLLCPLYELLAHHPVALYLGAQLLYRVVHKPLGEAHVALLHTYCVIEDGCKRIARALSEPLRSPVCLAQI